MARARHPLLAACAASALVLAAYLVAIAQLPLDVFWHPDEGAKYIGVRTVRWEQGAVRYELPYGGRALDPELEFYPARNTIYPAPGADGQPQFHWSIAFPLATRPFYDRFGIAGLYVLPIACGWLTAILAGVVTWPFGPRAAGLAILLTGLATPIAFYSLSFFEHTATTLFAGLAVALLVHRPGRFSTLLLMVPLLGIAVALRVETFALAAAALAAWAIALAAQRRWQPRGLLRPRRPTWLLALLAVALLVVIGALLVDVLPQRHLGLFRHIPRYLDRIWFKRDYFFDSVVRTFLGEVPLTDFTWVRTWQIAGLLALGGLVVGPFADTRRIEAALILPALLVLLQASLLTVLSTLPFLQRQGVLAVAPFMGVALMALPESVRRRDPRLLALSLCGALATAFGFLSLFAIRVAEHDGGSLLGLDGAVRYMLWIYPLGAAIAVVVLYAYRDSDAPAPARRLFALMVAALMMVSIYYEYLGVRELAAKRAVLAQWRAEIERGEPTLTEIWWLPAVLAPYWAEHPLYYVPSDALGRWTSLAAGQGIGRFSYATTFPLDPERLAGAHGLEVESSTEVQGLHLGRFRLAPGGGNLGSTSFPLDANDRDR